MARVIAIARLPRRRRPARNPRPQSGKFRPSRGPERDAESRLISARPTGSVGLPAKVIRHLCHLPFYSVWKPPGNSEIRDIVRRAKALIFSRCNSYPATVAPAGSNRSGSGGDETAEAFDGKGRTGGPASRQAVTEVNAAQASKISMWEPTRQCPGEGRRRRRQGSNSIPPTVPPG